ncbi:LysR family transcriptional regulator [Rhizobium leguminosarum]
MADGPRRNKREVLVNQLDLNLLRVFDALMAERNVNRAAIRIGRTQSAVSHALGKLRSMVGDELFVRTEGRMEPTAVASELAAIVTPSLTAIFATLNQQINFDPGRSTRAFRIGISDYTAIGFLPLFTRRFVEVAPGAKLNFLHTHNASAKAMILSRELDCAVLGNFTLDHFELRSLVLSEDVNLCAAWSGNDLLSEGLTLDTYVAAPHLQVSIDGLSEGVADKALAAMGRSRKVQATIPHYQTAPWVIRGTSLMSIVGSRVLLTLDPASETLMLEPPIPLPRVTISMIYNRQSEADPGHKWLRDLVVSVSNELDFSMNTLLTDIHQRYRAKS